MVCWEIYCEVTYELRQQQMNTLKEKNYGKLLIIYYKLFLKNAVFEDKLTLNFLWCQKKFINHVKVLV